MSKQEKTDLVYKVMTRSSTNKQRSPRPPEHKAKKLELTDLPHKILQRIATKYKKLLKYELRDWVKGLPLKKLHNDFLSENANAIDFLKENRQRIVLNTLSANTNEDAIELLMEKIDSADIDWAALSKNPNAIEILKANPKKIVWDYFCANTNPEAIEMLKAIVENEENLSIKSYREKHEYSQKYINWSVLSKNPAAIEILRFALNEEKRYFETNNIKDDRYAVNAKLRVDWVGLSANTAAIDLLSANKDKIDWQILSSNPKAIKLLIRKIEEERLLEETDPYEYRRLPSKYKIDWDALSRNPAIFMPLKQLGRAKGATVSRLLSTNLSPKSRAQKNRGISLLDLPKDMQGELLRNYKSLIGTKNILRYGIPINKLSWENLSKNPYAIDLLRKRMKFENKLSRDEYRMLPSKINWSFLCSNTDPGAIDLLRLPENYDKIDWPLLSYNSNAIYLLEDRVKYQLRLQEEGKMDTLKMKDRISWVGLSSNTAIFVAI
jgi:hypothetical protein